MSIKTKLSKCIDGKRGERTSNQQQQLDDQTQQKKTATKKREKIEYKKGEKENNCIV